MIKVIDIANKCGVSTATVSKALHNSKELKPETIAFICKTAKEMGYIPNASARSLSLRKLIVLEFFLLIRQVVDYVTNTFLLY